MTALVLLLVVVALVWGYRAAWRWTSAQAGRAPGEAPAAADVSALWRRREEERARRRERARQRRLPPLPAADAPPAGLAPLVPSPRTMRVEAARGIRDLEDWLAQQASA